MKTRLSTGRLRTAVGPGMLDPRPGEGVAGRLLTVADAAERLNVSENTVRGLCQARRLRHERIGLRRGAIRIPPEALEEYRRSATVEPGAGREPARRPRPVPPLTPRRIDLG